MTRVERGPAESVGAAVTRGPSHLVFTVAELTDVLRRAGAERDWLDVAFACSGILQAIDDERAGISGLPGRLRQTVSKAVPAAGRPLRLAAHGGQIVRQRIPVTARADRRLAGFRAAMWKLACDAAHVYRYEEHSDSTVGDLLAQIDGVAGRVGLLPAHYQTAVARIPSCFRSFDQHPRDVETLVSRSLAEFDVEAGTPVVIVGVRTSGSYLAPFFAAEFRQCGVSDVRIVSARSEQPLSGDDLAIIREGVRLRAQFVVCDDPPSSGYALASVCALLEDSGVERSSILLALALFAGFDSVPEVLRPYRSVVVLWDEWDIHQRLRESTVLTNIARVLDCPKPRSSVVRSVSSDGRDHVSLEVDAVCTSKVGEDVSLSLVVQGGGLGYFARHDYDIHEQLGEVAEKVYAVIDGVVYRERVAERVDAEPSVDTVLDYVAGRVERFPVSDDRSLELAGCQPVWEVAAEQLARVYGRFWPLARVLFVDRFVRRLVRANRLAVIDGAMGVENWRGGRKVDVAEQAFGNRDLVSFDPAFDAVTFAISTQRDAIAHEVRRSHSDRIEQLSPEKWLLYELVHLWDLGRRPGTDRFEVADRRSQAVRRYYADTVFDGVTAGETGPVVALDVDGVIETEVFGFKAPSPASALVIRSLIRHGYRPVVVTGRCVEDVQRLMTTFRLSGGVAEYGSAIVTADGSVVSTVSTSAVSDIERGRTSADAIDAMYVDPRYRHVLRVSTVTAKGKRRGLESSMIDRLRAASLQVVDGELQTDFVDAAVDKGSGLQALLDVLEADEAVLAVGDTKADMALLRAARRGAVPAHAVGELRSVADSVAPRPFQAGLEDIVRDLLGHRPGGCPQCRFSPSAETRAMLDVLRVSESRHRDVVPRTVRAIISTLRYGAWR